MFDIIGFPEYIRGVRQRSLLARSEWLELRDVEDIVNLPFLGKRESDGEGQDDLFHLEGAMIFVVQLFRWSTCFDVASVEHDQVPYLIFGGLGSLGVRVATYPLVRCLLLLCGFLVDSMYQVRVKFADRVEGS